jgi:hypothetical protein
LHRSQAEKALQIQDFLSGGQVVVLNFPGLKFHFLLDAGGLFTQFMNHFGMLFKIIAALTASAVNGIL